ncbi:MAG: rRNA maturation RNase YbeY [Proteobacteria bacterium]|nr:rRNA maturation RNase YbeY [Pseudomonadota bacterium]MDA1058065.1 rRNA maturation RNase YbeY [Pseudomonadota bacterium]
MKSSTKPASEIEPLANVRIDDEAWRDVVPDLEVCCLHALTAVFDATSKPPGQISMLFTDDAALRVLNATYRGQDKATNVLSFTSDPAGLPPGHPTFLGDIALALETILGEARDQGKTPAAHTHHMIVHGALHLLGYDHSDNADAQTMEDLERTILKVLDYPDPYAVGVEGAV